MLSLACTLLAAGRRAQGAGGEGEVFAERVDEVCLHDRRTFHELDLREAPVLL